MHMFKTMLGIFCVGALLVGGTFMTGCTKKPSTEDVSKLDDARTAAEDAEKKLGELRQERMKLEQDLQDQQTELQKNEQEKSDLENQVK